MSALWQLAKMSAPFLAHVAIEAACVIIIAAVGTIVAIEAGVRLGRASDWLRWAVRHEQRMRILRGHVADAGQRRTAQVPIGDLVIHPELERYRGWRQQPVTTPLDQDGDDQ